MCEEWELRPARISSRGSYNLEKETIEFFIESNKYNSNRITNLNEPNLVDWLLKSPHDSKLLWGLVGYNQKPLIFKEIKYPIIDDTCITPGDIDILMTCSDTPIQSVGIQCKRIKVDYSYTPAKVNKIKDIERGIKQSNKMLSLFKFWKNYLLIIIEIDAHSQKDKNVIFRGLGDNEHREIYHTTTQNELHEEIGLIFIEVVQPAENSYFDLSKAVFIKNRDAKIQTQPYITNKKVWVLIENKELYGCL